MTKLEIAALIVEKARTAQVLIETGASDREVRSKLRQIESATAALVAELRPQHRCATPRCPNLIEEAGEICHACAEDQSHRAFWGTSLPA